MAERGYAPAAVKNPGLQPVKPQPYGAARPAYRPQPRPPPRRRHSRSCCCTCCLWLTLVIIALLLLAAIAVAVFYVLYRPTVPSFSVASFHLSRFNLTETTFASAFNVTILAVNRNIKIDFLYDGISARVLSGGVDIGDGDFPAFTHAARNSTTLRGAVSRPAGPFSGLRSIARSRKLPIEIQLETKVSAKIGDFETNRVGIKVNCNGIRVSIPTGKTGSVATTSMAKCKVDPKIKIFGMTFTF